MRGRGEGMDRRCPEACTSACVWVAGTLRHRDLHGGRDAGREPLGRAGARGRHALRVWTGHCGQGHLGGLVGPRPQMRRGHGFQVQEKGAARVGAHRRQSPLCGLGALGREPLSQHSSRSSPCSSRTPRHAAPSSTPRMRPGIPLLSRPRARGQGCSHGLPCCLRLFGGSLYQGPPACQGLLCWDAGRGRPGPVASGRMSVTG